MRRKLQLSVLLSVLFTLSTLAQSIEITPFYGYALNGKLKTYTGDFNVADNPNYGAILSIGMYEGGFIELMYNRNDTEFNYNKFGYTQATIDMSTEYYQIGTLKQIDASEKVKPFGAFSLGATRFHPKEGHDWDDDGTITSIDDAWAFSATMGAGLKVLLSDKIGLRLQARLLLPMRFEGLFIGIGTGGASGGASFSVPLIAGDFTAGLVIRLGD